MTKKIFSLILSVIMVFSCIAIVSAAEETTDNYKVTFNCGDGTNNYTDLAYGNVHSGSATVPTHLEKTITVSENGNYTISLNAGMAGNRSVRAYIERVEGGLVSLEKTGALDKIENRVLFTNVPLEANVAYTVTIFNSTGSATIRIQDIVIEKTGEYVQDVENLTFLAHDYTKNTWATASVTKKHMVAIKTKYYLNYKLKPGAGNYKVTVWCKQYSGVGAILGMNLDGSLINTLSGITGTMSKYELGIISVTDDEFTLMFNIYNGSAVSTGVYISDIALERIDEPIVTIHSSDSPSATNVISRLQEGTMTAKAYLPETANDKLVNMFFAIYEGNELCYVEKKTIDSALKNQTIDVTLKNVAFEDGKTYTSKVLLLNDMVNMQALYKNPTGGSLVSATESESTK